MLEPIVYLAGPITGLNYGGATDWREAARVKLHDHNISGVSPMRAKDYLLQETTIGDSYEAKVLSSQKGITTRDRFDVQRADIVFMNLLGAERVSIGSIIEMGWADAFRVPIVAAMDEGNLHDHAMVRELAGFIVPSIDEALNVIVAILGPQALKRP
jgi:nucleoside 2-deoxyribosyltransferase